MRQTEGDEEDLLTPRGPPDAIDNDLDWDGGDRVISGIPIPRSHNVNIVKRAEDSSYRTSLRGPVKVDERSALLPRLPEEAPALIVSGRQSDCIPKSVPDVVIGQSTFYQTVSIVSSAFETSDLEPSYLMPLPFWLVLACFQNPLRSHMQAGSAAP